MMVQTRSKLLFIMANMCMSLTSGIFIAEKKSSFKHTYATLTVRSAIECCQQCKHEILCNSVNFCPIDKTCELNDKSPADFQYSKVIATPDTDLYYVGMDPCPTSWILYDRHCYLVVTTTLTWQQSEDKCNQLGAYLTDILNDFENTFVRDIGYDADVEVMWIGLGNYHTLTPHVWTSGRPLSVTYFNTDEPNNIGGVEDCICFSENDRWNDLPCGDKFPSVCKKKHY